MSDEYYVFLIDKYQAPKTHQKHIRWVFEDDPEHFIAPYMIYPQPGETIQYFGCPIHLKPAGGFEDCCEESPDYILLHGIRWRYVSV